MAITIDGQVYRNLQEQVQYLTDLTDAIGIDTTVTQNSNNLITSGAVYSYVQSLDANGVKY